jgi:hypothetical protein
MMSVTFRGKSGRATKCWKNQPCFLYFENKFSDTRTRKRQAHMDFLIQTKMTDAERDQWINNVKGLYNFAPHFELVSSSPPFVRFNLNVSSGGMIFAIITCLRYLNEFNEDIRAIWKLQKHLAMDFKEAFITHHFMSVYEAGHKLISPRGDFGATMAVQGVIEPNEPSWCLQKHKQSFTYFRLFNNFSGDTRQEYDYKNPPPSKLIQMYERLRKLNMLDLFKEYNFESKLNPNNW